MKLALIGATGGVGSAVLAEALQRGHAVTALARSPAKLPAQAGLTVVQADALDAGQVAAAVGGHDAVISAYNPGWTNPDLYNEFMRGSRAILAGTRQAGVQRLLVVGGAGSLHVAPGVQLIDTEQFRQMVPAAILPGPLAARDLLNEMRAETTLDWVFLSPPAALGPGERSGRYRVGADDLLMAGDKPAGISMADLAVAIVDEIETPRHHRQRFTVAST